MRVLISILGCIILSVGSSYFFLDFNPSTSIIQNLYAILGIMFSIGLSLVITFNLSGVKNKFVKNRIRENINKVRDNFIIYFVIISFFYILFDTIEQTELCLNIKKLCFIKYSHTMILLMIYIILYYIYNFLEIQKLNIEIEDLLD